MQFHKELRIDPGSRVRLKKFNPSETFRFKKERAEKELKANLDQLFDLQQLLYAENKRSLLIILQGMDAAGKDGVIRHVMRGLNPQGCTVTPFKKPSVEESEHDYLWRIHKAVPARGDIGIFNRSHYEDVLIARVNGLVPKPVWKQRYKQINAFERMLTENGVVVLKFFLCISREEQKERLQARLDDPLKNWKFEEGDLVARKAWDDYMDAYEHLLEKCSTDWAPWYVIPADKKWFRNLAVSEIVNHALKNLNMTFPKPRTDLGKIKID